jgi:hypothetical protein
MIVKSVVLRCGAQRAFSLFTEHAGQWWPADRRHTDDPASAIRIEASGRFVERASDGTEVDLGLVRLFEPAHRLVLVGIPERIARTRLESTSGSKPSTAAPASPFSTTPAAQAPNSLPATRRATFGRGTRCSRQSPARQTSLCFNGNI